MMPLNKDDLTNLGRSYLKSIEGMEFTIVPIERDDLTNQLDRIALALDTGLGYGPDTVRTAAKLMFQAASRLRAYEELSHITEGDLKELKSRVDTLERWRNDHESIEKYFTFP